MKANTNSDQTEVLLRLIRKGEQQAFTDLLKLYEPLVRAEVAHYTSGLDAGDGGDIGIGIA